MLLREYVTSDCKQLAELFYQTVHTVNAKDYTKEQLDVWATGNVDLEEWDKSFSEHYTIVAIVDEIIVGFGDIDKSGYLDRLYVHKDYQGKGIASALCDKLEKSVMDNKIVTHASITAKPFFEQRGYRVVKKKEVMRCEIALTNYVMEKADEKLSEVMEMIEKAAAIMEERDMETDKSAKKEIAELQNRIRTLTGKKQFDIKQIYGYWAYSDLETIATKLLMKEPQNYGLSDAALKNLILSIFASGDLTKEACFDYWYDFLELETGIEDVMDYLFCEDEKGEIVYAPIDVIMEQISQNRQLRN